jgi:hypothetical protein
MGLRLIQIDSRRSKKSPLALRVLAFVITAALPVNAFADAAAQAQLPVVQAATTPSQAASQSKAASTNSLASTLGKAAGVLSMAAGGLYMAKGAMQMKCCTQGCTGSGSASKTEVAKEATKAKDAASTIKRQPVDFFKLRFPDEANSCPDPRVHTFSLLELFQPPKAEADLSGCLDAGIALATGGLMLLNGMMGLAAASQSGQMADASALNASGMDSLSGATAGTPNSSNSAGTTTSGLGSASGASNPIKLDPALLRTGKADDIMNQFESHFGIPRDQFANGVIGGQDPRNLLNSAPKNALSNDDMNKALSGAKSMSDAERAAALAKSPMGDVQRDLASKMGGDAQYEMKMAGAGTNGSSLAAFGKKKDAELDPVDLPVTDATAALGLSPEVQAALSAKQLDDRNHGLTDLTIFQVVHAKYREKSKMIFGFDPDGLPKGGRNGI